MTLIGKILAERYEIIEEIGSGGMAVVYKAKCRLLNRYVAVKVLRPDLQNDQEFVRRFNVEAQAAASLTHPNIVSIYDVGYEDGLHYIVMEYIEGKTLKEYIEAKRILPWREASDYAIQIARGLEQAHKNSIIHRDVKPHNIIMTADGIMKVTDFGIARANVQSTVTCEDSAIGSVHYISPEQARGGYTDERSDIYSLGVVLYEMLTGKVPFDSDRPVTVAIMHLQEKPVMPRELNLSIPRPVENIVLKAMSKEISSRYKNATEFIADLQSVLNDPNREVVAVEEEKKAAPVQEESFDMAETRKMPAINLEIEEETESFAKEDTVVQNDVKPIMVADSNIVNRGDDEMSGRSKGIEIDKKKQKKVTWIAILSAVLVALVITLMVGSCLGVPAIFGCVGAGEAVVIPKVEGLVYEDAKESVNSELQDAEYRFSLIREFVESDKPEGIIISQDPKPENKVRMTEEIIIKVKVSAGKKKMELRDYTKDDFRDAQLQLQNLGLNVDIQRKSSEDVPKDVVIAQNPVAGAMVSKGDKIILYVSDGPEEGEGTIEVGNYVGKMRSSAEKDIKKLKLDVAVAEKYSSSVASGTVISQSPSAGKKLKEGQTVTLYVSKGPDPNEKEEGADGGNNESSDNGNNASEEKPVETKPQETKKKQAVLTIYGPRNKDKAQVRVDANGTQVFNKEMKKGSVEEIIVRSGSSSIKIEIYHDGVLQQTNTVYPQ